MDYIKYLRSMVGNEKVLMVVAGAFVFDKNRILLQQRTDNKQWGLPGGFMELGESVQEAAKREVYEETGLQLGELELFGIYSGSNWDKTFSNGDQVSLVKIIFTCNQFEGELIKHNQESMNTRFFSINKLPDDLFNEHKIFFHDLKSNRARPIID